MSSLFTKILHAFLGALSAVVGIAAGLFVIILLAGLLFSVAEKSHFSSGVKLLPDAEGNRKQLGSEVPILLQINIQGSIGSGDLKGAKIYENLLKSREKEFKDCRVKGLLLAFNSPGGDVTETDIIYRHVKEYKERYQVPVFAYIDGICASGGYYIAVAADKIYASDVSLIGSIGVLSWPPFLNLSELLQKIGVNSLTVSAGKGKDQLNPLRPWKEHEDQNYRELVNYYYDYFVKIVTENRKQIEKEKLIGEFGAKVFPATIAAAHGFIDKAGISRSSCLKELAQASGIEEGASYQVVTFESKEWFKQLFNEKPFFLTGKVKHELSLPTAYSPPHPLYLYAP